MQMYKVRPGEPASDPSSILHEENVKVCQQQRMGSQAVQSIHVHIMRKPSHSEVVICRPNSLEPDMTWPVAQT